MPKALIDKIEAAKTFNQGFATVEYLSSALVDMKLHMKPDGVVDADAFERETLAELGMPREIVMRHRLPQFNHLFSSDAYSAGYYSYLWSETMDADTWAAFEETGVWDKATADRFRTILLETGNETDRAEAYRAFRGRDPGRDGAAQAARLPGEVSIAGERPCPAPAGVGRSQARDGSACASARSASGSSWRDHRRGVGRDGIAAREPALDAVEDAGKPEHHEHHEIIEVGQTASRPVRRQ